jgi:hypothetical protein
MSNQTKDAFLFGLRSQWMSMLALKFQGDKEKLKTADMKELSKEAIQNPLLKAIFKAFGVTSEDIEKMLVDCRDELLKEQSE